MASVSRRVFLAAVLLVAVMAVAAKAVCDNNCASCIFDACIACKSGYYPTSSGCTPCQAEHCAHCEAIGWCIICEPGYHLRYVNDGLNLDVNQYGKCVNAASAMTATAALMTTIAALLYAVVA